MSVSNLNLKNIPADIMALLRNEAKKLGISVNTLILQFIETELGISTEKQKFHDLDHLFGTWTQADEKTFKKNTKLFKKIDKKLWNKDS